MTGSKNSFDTKEILKIGSKNYTYFSLNKLADAGFKDISKLPVCIKILLENLIRNEDGVLFTDKDINNLALWNIEKESIEIPFMPARLLMQDFTGVPAIVDLAAMRDAANRLYKDPMKINPCVPSELVIDHSVQVDSFGKTTSLEENINNEFKRNSERYTFLKWGQKNFDNFKVVPPATGICHQVNLEYLARVVFIKEFSNTNTVFPDSVFGFDSHTTMINGIGVLGWGVGGIEAEAVMLGNPYYLLTPQVLGFKLTGKLSDRTTATDLVLHITELLRKKGVVGKFVEFYGPGVSNISLEDRATIANMAPEYGATMGFFPVDDITLKYLRLTGRSDHIISLIETYTKEQGLFRQDDKSNIIYHDTVEFDMSKVQPCIAGPKKPQERIPLFQVKEVFKELIQKDNNRKEKPENIKIDDVSANLDHGSIVIAAITSCTNTSNPSALIGAGLLAKKALSLGLMVKPWVKTSLAPGSKVVAAYLEKSGLLSYLEELKFNIVAYGCTTCIGNSGPLHDSVVKAISAKNLVVASVLSGNRNFEGRISPLIRANFLASPALVVAYAIAGKIDINFETEPIGTNNEGKSVFLQDIWPSAKEISQIVETLLTPDMFIKEYSTIFEGSKQWQLLSVPEGSIFKWEPDSIYIKNPPFFTDITKTTPELQDIKKARVLALLGDSVTTDHISPAGSIPVESPAGKYLISKKIPPDEFNSFGSYRGNHEIMMRGTFGNIRLKNKLAPETTGGWTTILPEEKTATIYDAAMAYKKSGIPLIVIAGREYGTGSSRDWAAKGTFLLGVKAVIAQSFERIHRSNLVCMGVLPLQFDEGINYEVLELDGTELYDIEGIETDFYPKKMLKISACRKDKSKIEFNVTARIDSKSELNYFIHGGILSYVLRNISKL
ncbi:MAG: aconitate hydratase AcnA [Proteobacteria bacterium]|nr:aconitate hydratase AcnA [Pseudomonadota bacterium]